MERCDALVVGGGPAGSSCARELSAAGRHVIILDRADFPRDKTCAGWITPRVLEILDISSESYAAERVLQPIAGFRTGLAGRRAIETRYGEVVSYGIRRCEFDHYLLGRCGADVRTGLAVKSLRRDGADWIVNETYRAPIVVGAGGHFCPVAKVVAGARAPEPIVAAQEVEILMDASECAACDIRGDTPEFHFCADLEGYAWCFRKGNYLNIGLGRRDSRALPAHVNDFVEWLNTERRVPPRATARWKGHAYLLYESSPRPLVADGVLLVGDAAGLAYERSGEGILPAIESGILAARAIVGAAGHNSSSDLAPYRTSILARFGVRRPTRGLAGLVPDKWTSWIGARLLASPWFTRRFVLDRWFLHHANG